MTRTQRDGAGQATGQAHGDQQQALIHHQPQDSPAVAAQSHPDADLAGPLADLIRQHAVEADRRQQQRDDAERQRQHHRRAARVQRLLHPFGHREDVRRLHLGIDLRQRALHRGRRRRQIVAAPDRRSRCRATGPGGTACSRRRPVLFSPSTRPFSLTLATTPTTCSHLTSGPASRRPRLVAAGTCDGRPRRLRPELRWPARSSTMTTRGAASPSASVKKRPRFNCTFNASR